MISVCRTKSRDAAAIRQPPRPGFFSWVQRLVCYALERHFEGERYKSLAALFSRPENRINQGLFRPYRVTFARSFLMRSAVCLRVIRFRQSGQ